MPEPRWEYQARCEHVVDGDTLDLVIDVGFKVRRAERIRLVDVDTAEIFGVRYDSDEYLRGIEHKRFVEDWIGAARDIDDDWPLVVETEQETGSFNRYLADVRRKLDGESLSEALLDEYGDEVVYDG